MSRLARPLGLVLLGAIIAAAPVEPPATDPAPPAPRAGTWRASLASPGGDLPFTLEHRSLGAVGGQWWVVNGPERLLVPRVTLADDLLTLEFTHYDSAIRARVSDDGRALAGRWTKTQGAEAVTTMAFRARWRGDENEPTDTATPAAAAIDGRWSVQFSRADEPAVGLLRSGPDGAVTGTFLTTTGDYRYLAGALRGDVLTLSCFDGAHAFLFRAHVQPDGTLAGDFWSRDTWHETWTARLDPQASLPDAFSLTRWNEDFDLADLQFRDLRGTLRSPADPAYRGRARIIQIFGSWCPNCHDATAYLVELDRRYRGRGLSILGLAFEVTGDFDRDARQVKRSLVQQGATWPVLIAGTSDKAKASDALPVLDRVRAYPTTVFMDRLGTVRAVYTGFSGPATGDEHAKLRASFERLIEQMLSE